MEKQTDVSIIILTKNAEKNIKETILAIQMQKTDREIEIIVIDSGSADRTGEILKSFPNIKLIQQRPEEFQHGRTRNKVAQIAKGKYLVFLNGDAIPKDIYWLDTLLENFKTDDKVCGVYSRHLPKEKCHLYTAIDILVNMKPIKEIKTFSSILEGDLKIHLKSLMHFSTVSCAIKKDIWQRMPFAENLPVAEDQEWAKRMLEGGYTIIYEPSSMVFHSHNYTMKEKFWFHYYNTIAFNLILKEKSTFLHIVFLISKFPFSALREVFLLLNYCCKNKYPLIQILKEITICVSLRLGALLGKIMGNK